jgi:glycosyltransferase involved in cell wall biosynthesis
VSRPARILYVLNSAVGGASIGVYEAVAQLPRSRFTPYAIVPPASEEALARPRRLFADVRTTPLRWWNVTRDAGLGRRAAWAVGRWRRGGMFGDAVGAIGKAIDDWRIDLVHTGTAHTRGGALAARRLGRAHLWHIKECVGTARRVRFPMPDADLVRYIDGLSERVVAMSEYIAEVFRQHGCQNLAVLPDGVNLEPYGGASSRTLRQAVGVGEGEYLVGMVASMTSTWKRHDVFIRMAGLLARRRPAVRFIIVGPRPPADARWPYDLPRRYYSGLEHLVSEVVPVGRLALLDAVPDPPDIMRSLDVLVHPCDAEPFGRIAIEAMAAGTPVVGPTTGGIAETVVDGETGLLVTPGDPDAFAAATDRLLGNAELRRRLGTAGRRRARELYSIDRHVDRLTALYDEALAQHGA